MAREKRPRRHAMCRDAWLTLGGFARRHCKVLDLSSGGAKLFVDGPAFINGDLGLSLNMDVHKSSRCRMVWRDGNVIGVEFV